MRQPKSEITRLEGIKRKSGLLKGETKMVKDRNNHAYDDIINLPNPTSRTHPRMSPHDRAAQFSAFAALSGHGEAIKETARLTDERQELSEDAAAYLNEQLNLINENIDTRPLVTITYFVSDDRKSGGAYVSHSGKVKRIDNYERTVIMTDQTVIPIEQISEIQGELFGG